MSKKKIKQKLREILGATNTPKLHNNVSSLHQLFNNSVYTYLSTFKEPDKVFPREEAVTVGILNDALEYGPKRNIQFFNRIDPENVSGADMLLILKGSFAGTRKELRVLYQAKITHWVGNEARLKLDDEIKDSRLSEAILEKIRARGFQIKINKKWAFTNKLFQHEALYNFSRVIEAEPLYLMYRYKEGKGVSKSKSTSFIFGRYLVEKFQLHDRTNNGRRRRCTFSEKELGEAVFFPEDRNAVLKITQNDGGFFFFGTSLEESYRYYRLIFDRCFTNTELQKIKPCELKEESEGYSFHKIDKSEDFEGSTQSLYMSDGNIFDFRIKSETSEIMALPNLIMIWDLD